MMMTSPVIRFSRSSLPLASVRKKSAPCPRRPRAASPRALPPARTPPRARVAMGGQKKPAKKKKSSSSGGAKVSSQTPVFGSIEDGDAEEFAECLARTPQCVHETNKNGWTPAHQAAFSGEVEMLKTLIARGAAVDKRDHDGDTPVHYAAAQGEMDCIRALADAGCALELKDNDGETPVDVASKAVKKDLKALIKEMAERAEKKGEEEGLGGDGGVEEAAATLAAASIED